MADGVHADWRAFRWTAEHYDAATQEVTRDIQAELFECPTCSAVVADVDKHAKFHAAARIGF